MCDLTQKSKRGASEKGAPRLFYFYKHQYTDLLFDFFWFTLPPLYEKQPFFVTLPPVYVGFRFTFPIREATREKPAIPLIQAILIPAPCTGSNLGDFPLELCQQI